MKRGEKKQATQARVIREAFLLLNPDENRPPAHIKLMEACEEVLRRNGKEVPVERRARKAHAYRCALIMFPGLRQDRDKVKDDGKIGTDGLNHSWAVYATQVTPQEIAIEHARRFKKKSVDMAGPCRRINPTTGEYID